MDMSEFIRLVKKYDAQHAVYLKRCLEAQRYYRSENDIVYKPPADRDDKDNTPLRNADNRVPSGFHGLLVNQKASYMFTSPPTFDVGSDQGNKDLTAFLGDEFAKVCKDLCVNASNCETGWLHIWRKEDGTGFDYAVVPSEEVYPVYSKRLKKELIGVMRSYGDVDTETGKTYIIYEYWTATECQVARREEGQTVEELKPYLLFGYSDGSIGNIYRHEIGEIPWFPFPNNNVGTSDLKPIKQHIDTYDKVFSGFANDLEDIQEIIFVLTNYGGQDLHEFLSDLKHYKAIKVEDDGDGTQGGVSTLSIEIPVEAREKLLELSRKCIFEQGQGIDPDPQNFGNSSGVALKYLYSLLELKSGLQETEFRLAFGRFIRCVCRLIGVKIKDDKIIQTWYRTSVSNDLETAQIASQSKGIISDYTILKNHPWVDDPDQEQQQIDAEEQKAQEKLDMYGGAFQEQKPQGPETPGGDDKVDGKQ